LAPNVPRGHFWLNEFLDFLLIIDEEIDQNLGQQGVEEGWPDDGDSAIARFSILEKSSEFEKHFM